MDLFDRKGRRKYLSGEERIAFIKAAAVQPPIVRSFCETLAYSGCRITEALRLTAGRVDLTEQVVIFESLKKRRAGVFRGVPVPQAFLNSLDEIHGIRNLQQQPGGGADIRLYRFSRATAYRRVVATMAAAGISGPHATPRGLRHGFGVNAVTARVPLNFVQRWLGHSRLETAAIYCNAIGPQERLIASAMWEGHSA